MTAETIDYEANRLVELAQKHREDLPATAIEIADIIGLKEAAILMANLGGLSIKIPYGKTKPGRETLSMIADFIGHDGAEKLSGQYAGTCLYIPKCRKILINARNKEIFKDKAALEQSGLPFPEVLIELVKKYGITERYARIILKSHAKPTT